MLSCSTTCCIIFHCSIMLNALLLYYMLHHFSLFSVNIISTILLLPLALFFIALHKFWCKTHASQKIWNFRSWPAFGRPRINMTHYLDTIWAQFEQQKSKIWHQNQSWEESTPPWFLDWQITQLMQHKWAFYKFSDC